MPDPAPFRSLLGREIASDWRAVDQATIDAYADLIDLRYWLHNDPARAAREGPFGATVANGNLLVALLDALFEEASRLETARGGPAQPETRVNYGYDRVRFLAPVTAGSRVRCRATLREVEEKGGGRVVGRFDLVVDVAGGEKPAVVAEWLLLWVEG